ncbi:MAG: hypothetical protein ACP5QX_07235 [Caldisericaceae bacterium]
MYLLVVVLFSEKHVKEILERFVDIDVRGATVINSQGMGTILSEEIPIFSSLGYVLSGEDKRTNNFTIFSAIKTEKTLQEAIDTVLDVVKDINKPGTGIMIVLPVLKIYGLAENNIKKDA